jgi:hypothetical protein
VTGRASIAAGLVLFALAATANSAGYRFGGSDQAFYIPSIALANDPALFPRDRALFGAQQKMWLGRHLFAAAARAVDLPSAFAALFVLTLVVLFVAALGFARGLGFGPWAMVAYLCLLTLRHQIAKTGTNSLEGYMHPRMLAFALGLGAFGFFLRKRRVASALALAAAVLVHPTTAVWFGAALAIAVVVTLDGRARLGALVGLGAAVVAGGVMMQPSVAIMDADWRSVLRDKDYLFASAWPLSTWMLNLAYPVVIAAVYRRRRQAGAAGPEETGLVIGLLALTAGFLVSVPLAAAGIVAIVQLQIPRVFWVLDVVAVGYVAWWLLDDVAARRTALRVAIVAVLAALSVTRGIYVLQVQARRPLARFDLGPGDWTDAMRWLRAQPAGWHVLADPDHVWKYGSSVRVAAWRDVWLERGKDPAMALYDRAAAMRVAEREQDIGDPPLAPDRIARLDEKYAFDVYVAEPSVALDRPVLYRNRSFVIYDLR